MENFDLLKNKPDNPNSLFQGLSGFALFLTVLKNENLYKIIQTFPFWILQIKSITSIAILYSKFIFGFKFPPFNSPHPVPKFRQKQYSMFERKVFVLRDKNLYLKLVINHQLLQYTLRQHTFKCLYTPTYFFHQHHYSNFFYFEFNK